MNITIEPIIGFQLGIDYIDGVIADDGVAYNLLRISAGFLFIHIILGESA